MIIHALQTGTPFEYEIFVWCTITAYTITYSKYFLFKCTTRLQSMYNQIVGRTTSVVSLSDKLQICIKCNVFLSCLPFIFKLSICHKIVFSFSSNMFLKFWKLRVLAITYFCNISTYFVLLNFYIKGSVC